MRKEDLKQVEQKLKEMDEPHLLKAWKNLSPGKQVAFLQQIEKIDPAKLLEQKELLHRENVVDIATLQPIQNYAQVGKGDYQRAGAKALRAGKVGCLIAAGGSGSRLRFAGPKGLFPLSVVKHKTLFQLFAEKTYFAQKLYKAALPLAIMTSPANHQAIVSYFKQEKYFGLDQRDVTFFCQESLPLLDESGYLFLDAPGKIAQGPNGNGQALQLFYRSSAWSAWKARGIEYINYILIDNPLTDPFDPDLIGYHVLEGVEVSTKSLRKRHPKEKMGMLVLKNKKVGVCEYSEGADKLPLGAGYFLANTSLFCFSTTFIEKIALKGKMPLHRAKKAVKFLDESGKVVKAITPNAWKFEYFIFDVLLLAKSVGVLLYPRKDIYAPLKNYAGSHSPKTVREALQRKDREQIQKLFGQKTDARPLELSQEFYYPTARFLKKWSQQTFSEGGFF